MAGQLARDIKRRILSLHNMQQVTKAMEMVSAAKLRRAQAQVMAARPFANRIGDVLGRAVSTTLSADPKLAAVHPLLAQRNNGRTLLCAMAADRGLAGGYNANLGRALDTVIRLELAQGRQVEVVAVGRKVRDWLQRARRPVRQEFLQLGDEVSFGRAQEIARSLVEPFAAGEFDRVALVFTQFVGSAVHRPVLFLLLPIAAEGPRLQRVVTQGARAGALVPPDAGDEGGRADAGVTATGGGARRVSTWEPPYIYEPSIHAVLEVLLARYVAVEVYRALLEAKASEHGARMTAMRSASDNVQDLIETLTLSFNQARQAGITREISEIVGGAEALAARV